MIEYVYMYYLAIYWYMYHIYMNFKCSIINKLVDLYDIRELGHRFSHIFRMRQNC